MEDFAPAAQTPNLINNSLLLICLLVASYRLLILIPQMWKGFDVGTSNYFMGFY